MLRQLAAFFSLGLRLEEKDPDNLAWERRAK